MMDVFIILLMFGSAFCFQLALSIDGFIVKASEHTPFSNMQKDLLKIMNKGRRDVTPTASNMMKVRWDEDLATAAATIVDSCFFGISMPEEINLHVDKGVIQATGINKNGSFYLPDAFAQWFELGHVNYDYESFTCQAEEQILCKIYKLLTWSSMHKVGCSQRFCPTLYDSFSSKTEKNYIYWKCNYANISNFWEDGFSYSDDGQPCTKCFQKSGWCTEGLCDDTCASSSDKNNCQCVLDHDCNSNGVFLPEICECQCKKGYSGNSCQLTDSTRTATDLPQSFLTAPLFRSITDTDSVVLSTSSVIPAHTTVVSNFLINKFAPRREVRDVEPWTIEETTYVDLTTFDFTGSSTEEVSEEVTSPEYSTEEVTTEEVITDVTEFTTAEHTTIGATSDAFIELSTFAETTIYYDDVIGSTTEVSTTLDQADETTQDEVTAPDEQGDFTRGMSTDELTTVSVTTEGAMTPCSMVCQGEGRLDDVTCTCTCDQEGYTYNYTQSACLVCGLETPCNDQGVLDTHTCTCYCASGFQGEHCEEICNVTTTSCWDDYVPPDTALRGDYCPVYCPHCDSCADMTCQNDGHVDKISGFEDRSGMCRCYCPLPWSGLECDDCNLICSNGGTLNSTECTCQCLPGSSGFDCSNTCIQKSMLCTQNAFHHCNMPVIAKNCPELCGICES